MQSNSLTYGNVGIGTEYCHSGCTLAISSDSLVVDGRSVSGITPGKHLYRTGIVPIEISLVVKTYFFSKYS